MKNCVVSQLVRKPAIETCHLSLLVMDFYCRIALQKARNRQVLEGGAGLSALGQMRRCSS